MTYLLPPDIAHHRQILFDVPQPLIYTPSRFHAFWPFLSNVWEQTTEAPRTKDHTTRANHSCRCRRDAQRKRPATKNLRQREFSTLGCSASIAVTTRFDPKTNEPVEICVERSRDKKYVTHSHSLEFSDKRNLSRGMKQICERLLELTPYNADVLKRIYRDSAFDCVGGKALKYDRIVNLRHMTPSLGRLDESQFCGEREYARPRKRRGSPLVARPPKPRVRRGRKEGGAEAEAEAEEVRQESSQIQDQPDGGAQASAGANAVVDFQAGSAPQNSFPPRDGPVSTAQAPAGADGEAVFRMRTPQQNGFPGQSWTDGVARGAVRASGTAGSSWPRAAFHVDNWRDYESQARNGPNLVRETQVETAHPIAFSVQRWPGRVAHSSAGPGGEARIEREMRDRT